jgi:type III secretion system YscD/HrpQ family protein
MKGYLIAEEGPLAGLVIRLEDGNEWIIGRDPSSFQVLEDPMVSRKHLICRLTAQGFVVENLSSTNPASLNGNPIIDPLALEEGDILQIGNTLFKFSENDPSFTDSFNTSSSLKEPTIFEEESPLDIITLHEPSSGRWMLKVISGPNTGAEFGLDVGQTYVAGKDPSLCEIVFQDLSVSRQHAKLSVLDDGTVLVEDLSSKNGTYVNGHLLSALKSLVSQDVVAIGTTSFLVIDKEQTRETIFSPTPIPPIFVEKEEEKQTLEEEAETKKSFKDLVIPTKHLIFAGCFAFLLLVGVTSAISLFKSHPVSVVSMDDEKMLKDIFKKFPGVEYSFNKPLGKIFIMGNVISGVEKQELYYLLKSLPFLQTIEDTVVIDDIITSDMNAFISKNPSWRAVSITTLSPGKFTIRGYVQTLQDATALMEYLAQNFPYNEKLENQVVVANNLEAEIQSLLTEKGFINVTFQLASGEIVLGGRVNDQSEKQFDLLVKELKKMQGIRSVKNFVIMTTASTTRINLSDKYRITGTSKLGNISQYVVINGQILTMGDLLDGMSITQIESDAVLLEKDGLKYRINYNQQ